MKSIEDMTPEEIRQFVYNFHIKLPKLFRNNKWDELVTESEKFLLFIYRGDRFKLEDKKIELREKYILDCNSRELAFFAYIEVLFQHLGRALMSSSILDYINWLTMMIVAIEYKEPCSVEFQRPAWN